MSAFGILKRTLSTVLLGGLLGACEEGPSTVVQFATSEKVMWNQLTSVIKDGKILTVIHGNPFQEDDISVHANVLKAMEQSIKARTLQFTTDPAEVVSDRVKIIIALGVPKGFSGKKLCGGESSLPKTFGVAEDGKLYISGIVCLEDERRAQIRGWVKGVETSGDKRFDQLLSQTVRNMFPNK